MLQVTRALRAFDKLETLAVVDEDATEYNASLHDRLFVAEVAESMLRNAGVTGRTVVRAPVHVACPSHLVTPNLQ